MIDSHAHLADKKFTRDLDEVIFRAKEEGVSHIITIADTIREGEKCIQIAEKYSNVFAVVGVHPHAAKNWQDSDSERLKKLISSSGRVKAIGEIGLDYFYDNSPRNVQQKVFKTQLEIARDLDFPVVIHCRKAIDNLKTIINEVGHSKLVIHCCTEEWNDISDLVDRGLLLGFTGIATYPKSSDIREVIKNCPLDQIMIETDAPYLAPDSKRGKRNEPAFVVEVAKLIAEIKGVSYEEVDEVTTKNTVEFYGLPF
ncbi:TatD family hydrolase [Patescibacteria group bacterium]|nr:TatD family hydrolase [Patescibacteria group bacterium]MBU1123803.1 TatD family hydrolase [Patescibacteria group bacterium]